MGGGGVGVDVDFAGCATVPLCQPLPPLTPSKPKKERETRDSADNWSSRDQTVLTMTMTLFFPSISANPAAKRVDKDW